MLSALAVWIAALLLYAIARRVAPDSRLTPLVSALFFIFLSTEDQGLAGDAELYIAPFIAASILALAPFDRPRLATVKYVWAGLAAGGALQMMLLAAPIVAVLVALVTVRTRSLRWPALFLCAAAAPFAVEALFYAGAGAYTDFYDANAGATLRRLQSHAASGGSRDAAGAVLSQFRILAPPIELAVLAPWAGASAGLIFVWGWLGGSIVAIVAAGEYYDRHFLLLAAPLSVLGALGTAVIARTLRRPMAVTVAMLIAAFFMHDYFMAKQSIVAVVSRAFYHRDPAANDHFVYARDALRANLGRDRSLYLVNESPLLYDELGATPPTRYPFASDLFERGMWPMLGEPGIDEVRRILDTRPHYILAGSPRAVDDPQTVELLHRRFARDYEPVAQVDGAVLYRLKVFPNGPT